MRENHDLHEESVGVEPAPENDADSDKRLEERILDRPHSSSSLQASDGAGTVSGPPLDGGVLRHPILDGSTQSEAAEASTPNPYRGVDDPGTISKQPALNSTNSRRWIIAGSIATVLVGVVLALLMRFDPVWSGIGMVAALGGLLAMAVLRAVRMDQRRRLRMMAVLLAWIWLVPTAIIVTILIGQAEEIF